MWPFSIKQWLPLQPDSWVPSWLALLDTQYSHDVSWVFLKYMIILAIILLLSCHENIFLYLLATVDSVVRKHEAKDSVFRNRKKST